MSTNYKRLIDGETVGTSVSTGYTTGTSLTTVIHKLTISNYSSSAATVTVYLVPSGSSAASAYTVCYEREIPAGESWDCHHAAGHVLETGGTLQYVASVPSAVAVIASGVEITT